MCSFRALRKVHIVLLYELRYGISDELKDKDTETFNDFVGRSNLVFRVLKDLSEVTVAIEQGIFDPEVFIPKLWDNDWTTERQLEYAQLIEQTLLDPDGTETWDQGEGCWSFGRLPRNLLSEPLQL